MEAYRRGVKNGTDNADIQKLSIKAEWMLNGGKTSDDWNSLSVSDIKLLTVDYYAKEERRMRVLSNAFGEAMFGKKKRQGDISHPREGDQW